MYISMYAWATRYSTRGKAKTAKNHNRRLSRSLPVLGSIVPESQFFRDHLTQDMVRINKIFTPGKYDTLTNIIPDCLRLGIDAADAYLDPHGKEYAEEKERLLGVLVSTKQRKSKLFAYPLSCLLLKSPRQSVSFYQRTQPTRFKPE